MTQKHALYRFYDCRDRLLYIGITARPDRRFAQHRSGKTWWEDVSRIELTPMSSREEALQAEEAAIKQEEPAYNVIHNRERFTDGAVSVAMSVAYESAFDLVEALTGSREYAKGAAWSIEFAMRQALADYRDRLNAGEDHDEAYEWALDTGSSAVAHGVHDFQMIRKAA